MGPMKHGVSWSKANQGTFFESDRAPSVRTTACLVAAINEGTIKSEPMIDKDSRITGPVFVVEEVIIQLTNAVFVSTFATHVKKRPFK